MTIQYKNYRVKPGKDINFSKIDTKAAYKKPGHEELQNLLQDDTEKLAALQYKLFAENRQALLIILQGMDSAGKDSIIKYIISGTNPQGVAVHSFKHPSDQELKHDYLWRHYQYLPEQGQVGIFNRSHYENVLISKVHPEIVLAERIPGIDSVGKVDKDFWAIRYRQINDFEKIITQNGTCILKFFLHLSKGEQRKRFLERIENKEKHWKFASADIVEREFWKRYQQVYEEAFKHTHTPNAPWYIIPADEKWFTRLLIGKIIREKLKSMDPRFPALDKDEAAYMKEAKEKLIKGK